jgi:hypothetical protein
MAQFVAALVLIVATAAFMSSFRAAAVSPALLQSQAIPAYNSLQRTLSRFKQLQRSADSDTSNSAFFMIGNETVYWHTAQLSVARDNLAATSLPYQGLALFAGGYGEGLRSEYDE